MIYVLISLATGLILIFNLYFEEENDWELYSILLIAIRGLMLLISLLMLLTPLGLHYKIKNETYPLYEVAGKFPVVHNEDDISVLFLDDDILKKGTYKRRKQR